MAIILTVAKARSNFVYTVGHSPLIYTNGHGGGHLATEPVQPVQPLQYVRPTVYANNACRNNLGELVPCAYASFSGSSVYAYNNVPDVGFLQATAGVAAVQPLEAIPEAAEPPAPEDVTLDIRNGIEKREADPEAEADPGVIFAYPVYGYHGYHHSLGVYAHHGYAPYGCRNGYGAVVPCAGK